MSIATQIDALTTDRNNIRTALVNQGVSDASSHGFDSFASDIASIPPSGTDVSDTTAVAADVRSGKWFYLSSGVGTHGTLPDGSATTPATTISVTPSVAIDSTTGEVTASVSGSQSVTPTVSTGYVSSGTAGTVSVSGSNTLSLSTAQGGTITPTESQQTAVAAGKYTLGAVTVGAIPSDYVGSGIDRNDSTDLTVSGATVTAPAGYYAADATKTIGSGALAASGTASSSVVLGNLSYDSQSEEFTSESTTSITGTATATVSTAGYVGTSATGTGSVSGTATARIEVPVIEGTVTITGTPKVTPVISRTNTSSAGATNVGSGSASTTAPSSGYFVSVQSAAAANTITASPGVTTPGYGTSSHNGLVGDTESVGANASEVTYITVPGGSATTPSTSVTSNPTVTIDSSTGIVTASHSASQSVTPTVSAGYVESGTSGTVTTSGSGTLALTTQAATTYNTSSSDQTIAAEKYLTGAQTIKAVQTSNISAANIKYGVNAKVGDANSAGRIADVTGTFTGSNTVSSGQTAATASQILTGYSAWVDGIEVQGTASGGGVSNTDAILVATVSHGASASMTKQGVATPIEATEWEVAEDGTVDYALFVIPPSLFDSQNKWSVTATGLASPEEITIDESKQYSLDLRSAFYLYKDGSTETTTSGGLRATKIRGNGTYSLDETTGNVLTANATFSSGTNALAMLYWTVNKIDITNYDTLHIYLNSVVYGTGVSRLIPRFGILSAQPSSSDLSDNWFKAVGYLNSGDDQEYTLSLKGNSGEYYIGFGLGATTGTPATSVMSRIWLD